MNSNEKLLIVLSHLSIFLGVGILLPLIVYLVQRGESERVAYHAREALNFHLSIFIYCIGCIPLIFIIIGVPLLWLIGIASLILAVIAAVKSVDGVQYRYPLTIRMVG